MNDGSYLPLAEAKLRDWLTTFLDFGTENQKSLQLSDEELETLKESAGAFAEAIPAAYEAVQTARSLIAVKHDAKQQAVRDVRGLVNKIQGLPDVSPELKLLLGLNPHTSKPTRGGPLVPRRLSVTGSTNGTHTLKWNRSGNTRGTLFLIEAQKGTNGAWQMVGSETQTKFTHTGQTPGVPITYRVRAKRRQQISDPSNLADLYKNP